MRRTQAPSQRGKTPVKRAKSIQKASTVAAPRRSRIEVKRVYTPLPFTTVSNSGQIEPLPLIAAGNESDEREGRAVQIKGWEVRGLVSGNTSTGGSLTRIIVFKWKRVGAAPTLGSILYDDGGSLNICRSYNIEEAANYDILQDRVYNTGARTIGIGGTSFDKWEEYVHLYGSSSFIQTYSAPALNTVTDQQLYCLAVSEHPSSTVFLSASVSFIDI